jgi:hypothetical protein
MLAHRLALAGRALLTYALNAFIEVPIIDGTGIIDLIGNSVFAFGAVILLILTFYKARKSHAPIRDS